MAFKGLFVGIDRYASVDINWLSCARRDATALHAIFADTLGGESSLITDDQATKDGLRLALERLSACDPNDVVVIGFSGHGTPTHDRARHLRLGRKFNCVLGRDCRSGDTPRAASS
jgi:helicase